jgi:hypothetical protein
MLKNEIKIGKRYNVQGRCAEVTSDPEPHPYKERRYRWHVRFPLESEHQGKEIVGRFEASDFAREWTEDDQRRHDAMLQREAEEEASQNLLHDAGFPSATVTVTHNGGAYFRMDKEEFDKLVEILLVHNHNKKLEEAGVSEDV